MPVSALTSTRQASFCQHGRSLPSPPEISAFYSRLNHAYMYPLACVKYGAAALALGPAHSGTVPRGAASEYRICVSIIISAYGIYYLIRGGVEGPAGTANAVPLFTVVRIAVPLFKAGRIV